MSMSVIAQASSCPGYLLIYGQAGRMLISLSLSACNVSTSGRLAASAAGRSTACVLQIRRSDAAPTVTCSSGLALCPARFDSTTCIARPER